MTRETAAAFLVAGANLDVPREDSLGTFGDVRLIGRASGDLKLGDRLFEGSREIGTTVRILAYRHELECLSSGLTGELRVQLSSDGLPIRVPSTLHTRPDA